MATLASTAAVAPGAAAFDRIFSETATVVTELGEMAQKVIETEAAAAPREQSWFDEPDLDALKKLTGHTLYLLDDDTLRVTADPEASVTPAPGDGAMELTFTPE